MEQQEKAPSALAVQLGETPGVGMSMKAVSDLLATAHKTIVPQDDAILMVATMLNAYLGEVQKLHARHENGLSRLMAEKTDTYVAGVNTAVEQLSTMLSLASVEGVRKIFDAHAATLNAFRYAVYFAAAVVATSALLNVAVFVLKGIR